MEMYGRSIVWTDVPEVTSENIIDVLTKAFPVHLKNFRDIKFLDEYEKGKQPLQRKEPKSYRPDIDFETVDNVAAEATEFNTSYRWGNPITLIQRGEIDAGEGKNESPDVALLNECYDAEDINSKNQELGRWVEICGVGYTFVDINSEYEDGDSYFTVDILDPKYAFLIRSNYYVDHRPMVGVSFRIDDNGLRHITAFTKYQRFEIEESKIINGKSVDNSEMHHGNRSGETNPLGIIPIVEYIRSYDRTGCFERQIAEMDALNLLESNVLNQVDQQTQVVWHTNDVDFPVEEVEVQNEDGTTTVEERVVKPESNDWLQTYTTPDGKQPFIRPLAMEYNYQGILENIMSKRSLILQKCGVPERNSANGGSTGVAMSDATGWSAAESSANKQQLITESAKMQEVKVVLRAIKKSADVPADSPLLNLKYRDIRPNVKRNRSFDLITKSNALATLLSHGVNGLHAFKTVNLFEDNTQVWVDSEEMITKYQKKLFEEEKQESSGKNEAEKIPDRTASDISDQKDESPVVDGNNQINYSEKNRKG
jgi:SPP1 family phage portal protein